MYDEHQHGPPSAEAESGRGRQTRRRAPRGLSRRALSGPQTVEAYLRANTPPRYMVRLREIEIEFSLQRRKLMDAYERMQDLCGHDREQFARRWREQAARWRFGPLNDLIREHNDWYPVEANLPMDPRTRDYVPIRGASYRRIELSAEWILEHLPAAGRSPRTPPLPRRVPREATS